MKILLITNILYLLVLSSNAAKIGIFTAPISNSQVVFNNRLAEVLADGGHDVVIVRPTYNPNSINLVLKHEKVKEIRIDALPMEIFERFEELQSRQVYLAPTISDQISMASIYKEMFVTACRAMLYSQDFIDKIRAENIELAFHHHIDYCQLGIMHHLNISKFIGTGSGPPIGDELSNVGIPLFPSVNPNILCNSTNTMTFLERTKSFLAEIFMRYLVPIQLDYPQTALLRERFGPDFPSVDELKRKAKLLMLNSDDMVEFPILLTKKIIMIGGIGVTKIKPLKEPFSSFYASAASVVVISFGSVASASRMPLHWKESFIYLFKKNPNISFIWKQEEQLPVPSNVLLTHWMPQADLLGLNKTVAFITHGGYNSLGEAIEAGTPCLLIPLILDQYRNARLAEYRGFGISLNKFDISGEKLDKELHKVLDNKSYLQRALQMQKIVRKKPLKPEQLALYWTNFVLENELDFDLPALNTLQFLSIDVLILLIGILIFVSFLLYKIVYWYYWSCCLMAYKEKETIDRKLKQQ